MRDELDGKISTDTTTATATIPWLKQNEGTYLISEININDHGYAETYYFNLNDNPHPAIGTTFTIGDGSTPTCPLFTQNYGSGNITVGVDENEKSIGTFSAIASSSDTLTYSIAEYQSAGASIHNLVEINSSTGALSFINAPDYEGDISYSGGVKVIATSASLNKASNLYLTVKILNLNDNAPVFTSSATLSADENQTAIGTVTASDADGSTITYSLSGTDKDSLEIDSASGVLTFKSAPDFETKSSYSITVTASDGVYTVDQQITVTINDLNDNSPTITSNTSFTVNENQIGVGQIIVSDADNNSSFTFAIAVSYTHLTLPTTD
mgnify:FL=1